MTTSSRPSTRRRRGAVSRYAVWIMGVGVPLLIVIELLLVAQMSSDSRQSPREHRAFQSSHIPEADDWATQPLWDDGKAEVATYYATETIYGKQREHEAVLITVKEDFHAEQHVKADWPYDAKPVITMMKTNLVEEVDTDNYPYRSMTSVFAPRDDVMRPHKMTYTLHEWCGNTYKELRQHGGEGGERLVYHTYWEGIASGETPLDGDLLKLMPEEQLFMAMRALPFAEGSAAVGMEALWENLGELRGSRDVRVGQRTGTVRITNYEPIESGTTWEVGGADAAWTITIDYHDPGPDATFRVADNDARTLLFADFGDGRTYRLKDVTRDAYWVHE